MSGAGRVAATLNGVDLDAVRGVRDGFAADPGAGFVPFAAQVVWRGGYTTDVVFDEHAELRADEPAALAGTGTGPSPEELLLGAIGHCLAVGYAGAAAARGIAIERLSIDVGGAVNLPAAYGVTDGHPGFEAIDVDVRLDAPDARRDELDALHEQVVAQAPIPNTVSQPTPVTVRLRDDASR